MHSFGITAARAQFAHVLSLAERQPVLITQHGHPLCAMVPTTWLYALLHLEANDQLDAIIDAAPRRNL